MKYLMLVLAVLGFNELSANDPTEFFDANLIKYYKVDSCKINMFESYGGEVEKRLSDKFYFNASGQLTKHEKISAYEDEPPTVTTYEYNMSGQLISSELVKPESNAIVTEYFYKGKTLMAKKVNEPQYREYEVYANDEGVILSMIGRSMVPEKDTLKDELTGREIMGVVEEYEYRYNRFNKRTREVYFYYGNEFYNKEFDYGPNGNSPVLGMKLYRNGSTQVESQTTYTYGGNNLIIKEETEDLQSGDKRILEYEYFYAPASPMTNQPKMPSAPVKFSPTKKGPK